MERQLLKVTEVAEVLSLSRSRVYELITDGGEERIPVVRIGRSVRVPAVALREWVERQMAEQGIRMGCHEDEAGAL